MTSLIPNSKKKDEEILYIIGNGFDRAHDLPTSYDHFHQWLLDIGHKTYVQDFEELYPDVKDIKGRWCDVESALGKISLKEAIEYDLYQQECPNDIREENSSLDAYRCGENLKNVIFNLPPLLRDWANSIPTKDVRPEYELCKDARFLSFNYTRTLENIYNIKDSNILHIHETVVNNRPLVVGCGEALFDEDNEYTSERDDVDVQVIRNILSHSKKPVKAILKENEPKKWLGDLREISSVVVFGHSCSMVDKPYFEVISEIITTDASWTFFVHDPKDNDYFNLFANSIKKGSQTIEIIYI